MFNLPNQFCNNIGSALCFHLRIKENGTSSREEALSGLMVSAVGLNQWSGSLLCVLGQDTLLSHYLCNLPSTNGSWVNLILGANPASDLHPIPCHWPLSNLASVGLKLLKIWWLFFKIFVVLWNRQILILGIHGGVKDYSISVNAARTGLSCGGLDHLPQCRLYLLPSYHGPNSPSRVKTLKIWWFYFN